MWKIDPSFALPKEFELYEDDHFVYLHYHGQRVRIFNAAKATPQTILAACQEFITTPELQEDEQT